MAASLAIGVVVALLAAAAAVALTRQQRRIADLRRLLDELEAQLQLQQQGLHGLAAGSAGVDRRLRCIEAREQVLSQRQDTMESAQADERPYHHAIQLVQQGASVRRLMEELELSESEADLIVRLHGASAELVDQAS